MVFSGRKIIILQVINQTQKDYDSLVSEIEANHGEIVAWDHRADIDVSPKLIVVSPTIDYERSQEMAKFMVPTVTKDWIHASVKEGKLVPMRPYSPDPKWFMRDVIACISGIDRGDAEIFKAGIQAWGGDTCDVVTRYTTHIIATNIDTPECQLVLETRRRNPEINIKLVKPEWIDDCMKLMRKVDSKFYSLDEPIPETQDSPKLTGTFYVSESPRLAVQQSVEKSLGTNVLEERKFYLGSDLALSDIVLKTVKYLIETNGGKISEDLTKSDVYLGKWRDGEEYLNASKLKVIVGNITWFYWMVIHQKFEKPVHLLHYPEVRGGLASFKKLRICVTNYTGDARAYLQSLIESIGATYTGKLVEKSTTHLITAFEGGQKYEAAKNWNIPTVNHLWLEDSYAYWHKQDEQSRLYTYFPQKLSMSTLIGSRSLVPTVLHKFQNPFESVDEQHRTHHKRQAKRKAGDWLHDAMIIEGEFQKNIKRGKLPVEAEQNSENAGKNEKDASGEAEGSHTSQEKVPVKSLEKPAESRPKRQAKNSEPANQNQSQPQPQPRNLKIMFSGVDEPPSNKECHSAGLSIAKTLPIDVLVAPRFMRTIKFLQALAQTTDFVKPLWIDSCISTKSQVEVDQFRIEDETLDNALKNREALNGEPLFAGVKFYLDPKLRGKNGAFRDLVKAHGGTVATRASDDTVVVGDNGGEIPFEQFIDSIQCMDKSKLETSK